MQPRTARTENGGAREVRESPLNGNRPLAGAEALQLALARHRAGLLAEAAGLYRRVLVGEPGHADAWHLLGLTTLQGGRAEPALSLLHRAVRSDRTRAPYHNSIGEAWWSLNRPEQAMRGYRQAASLQPDYFEAMSNMAKIQRTAGRNGAAVLSGGHARRLRPADAEAVLGTGNANFAQGLQAAARRDFRRAVALAPGHAEAMGRLASVEAAIGNRQAALMASHRAMRLHPQDAERARHHADLLHKYDHHGQAERVYRRALALQPDFAEVFNNLGGALLGQRRSAEARRLYERALTLRPDFPDPYNNAASALWETGEAAAAVACYRRAIALKPDHADSYGNLGYMLRLEARVDADYAAAETACRRSLTLRPGAVVSVNNMGIVHLDMGRLDQAERYFRELLTAAPEDPNGHFNLAVTLLKAGRLAEAWDHFEERWATDQLPRPNVKQPPWQGEDLAGRTILLHAEQGHGDTLHFVRYAPLVAARGGRVLLAVQPALKRLLSHVEGVDAVYGLTDPIPGVQLHCPLMSLPRAFGTVLDTIPANVPYLVPEEADVARWRGRLPQDGRLRVGLVWSGDPRPHVPRANATDRRRSLTLDAFAPLASVREVRFLSLQKGAPAAQAKTPPAGLDLLDLMDEVTDFADTAALIANLDLVITVDTSVAHLAGGLGKPTWVLSRYDGCWRWLQDRDDTPWYPTMRLFRQPSPGAWTPAIERIVADLRALAG